jgi:predicted transcriptional regulator of viral defense system
MGKKKHMNSVIELFEKTPVVSSRDIMLVVKKSKDSSYAHLLVHNLIKNGRIKKIVKGFYTIHDDPVISVFCFKPSYIGLQDALSFLNLWEQESNVVIITSRKVRTGPRKILGSNVILHNIKPKYLFGFELMKYGDFFVPVSDIEKTLIDFVYFGENLDSETLDAIKKRIDIEKMNKYLNYYPKKTREKILDILR